MKYFYVIFFLLLHTKILFNNIQRHFIFLLNFLLRFKIYAINWRNWWWPVSFVIWTKRDEDWADERDIWCWVLEAAHSTAHFLEVWKSFFFFFFYCKSLFAQQIIRNCVWVCLSVCLSVCLISFCFKTSKKIYGKYFSKSFFFLS